MRVLYFHQHFSTRAGAAGTRSYEMAKRLIERGHSVTMVCASNRMGQSGLTGDFIRGSRSGLVEGIEVIEFDLGYSNRLSFVKRVVVFLQYAVRSTRLALKEEYDLLFATSAPLTAAIPGIAMKSLRREKRPFVFEIRDPWPDSPRALGAIKNPIVLGLMEWLETLAYRAADGYIALSPGMVQAFTKKGVPKERVAMIPNGCDNECVEPSSLRRFDLVGIEPGDFVAVFTGAHGFANGLDRLIDAASMLMSRGQDGLKIVLIGDGAKKEALQRRVKQEGLADVVLFFDPIPKEVLQPLLTQADLGLMLLENVPVFYYGCSPNKFFDYLSCGIPVLVNHQGWVRDMLEESRCGFYADPSDPNALADEIELAMKLPNDARLSMGLRARRLGEERFDRRDLSNLFVDVIEETLDRWTQRADHLPSSRRA
ncbi:MAG: glycosyltransferase family 4 protein [Fimbriimonas sp.]|nr:glycosyltransferase family 4 protein [Fimbriimonas sp.]